MSGSIRIIGTLVGDVRHKADMRIKYGLFFEALGRRFDLVDVFDANLHGLPRYWNAIQMFTPSLRQWKEHFFKNVPAFQARSSAAAAHVRQMAGQADVVLQLGALFDVTSGGLPVVVYTDNTARISARRPDAGRIPFHGDELESWLRHEKALYQRAVQVCVRSHLVRHSLINEYGLPGSKVSVVGAGVNLKRLPAPGESKTGDPFRILFIGTDFYRKGGDLVLQAFARIRPEWPTAELWIVTQESVPAHLPMDGVNLLPPIWQRERLMDLYRQADIFVLPSRQETWGDVLLEAMAYGLPCIGVTGQAMEEIIRPGETGILVPPQQVEALAGAMVQLLTQVEARRRMGWAGWGLVQCEYTWDRIVERIAPFIESAVQPAYVRTTSSRAMLNP